MRYASLRQGLVGAWCPSLGATGYRLLDRSGYGNHGTLTNMDAGTDWVGGPRGPVLDFDGINDHISIPANQVFNVGNSLTVSAFVLTRLNGVASGMDICNVFVSGSFPFISYGLELINSNLFCLSLGFTDNDFQRTATSLQASLNQLYHVCGTFDKNTAQIYLNGRLENSRSFNKSILYTANSFWIGTYNLENLQFWNGTIDDVRIYNRALTPAEIRILASEPGIGLRPERVSVYFPDAISSRRRKILTGLT